MCSIIFSNFWKHKICFFFLMLKVCSLIRQPYAISAIPTSVADMSQDDDDPAPCSGPSNCSSTNRTKRTKVYKGTTLTFVCLIVILNICEVVNGYHHSVQDVRVLGFSRTRDSAFVRFRYRCGIGSSDEKTRNGEFLMDVGLAKHKEGCQP